MHLYQRTCAVYKETCTEEGTVHVVAGNAGAALEESGFRPHKHVLKSILEFGFLDVQANFQRMQVVLRASADGSVLDSFIILRRRFRNETLPISIGTLAK